MECQRFKVIVPATTANLGAGLDCLGLALTLYNEIEIFPSDSLRLVVQGEGSRELAARGNLIQQTFESVFQDRGEKPPLVEIHCTNRIPLAQGLGSSAAARIGAIVAANHCLGGQLTQMEVFHLAAQREGHPDNVAAALYGGLVVCGGTGRDLTVKQIRPISGIRVVVLSPHYPLKTEEARRVLPEMVPMRDAITNLQNTTLTALAFQTGEYTLLAHSLSDRLHQPYREPLLPGFQEVMSAARGAGAYGAALSGAGPTVAAFTQGHEMEVARAMKEALALAGGGDSHTRILDIDDSGTRISIS